jgi:capsular exopolysaccharide synthesis family protein
LVAGDGQMATGMGFGQPVPPGLSITPNIFGLLKALKRRWLLAATLGILCAAVAAGAAWYVVPTTRYQARALLHYPARLSYTPVGLPEPYDQPLYRQTTIAFLRSQKILTSVLNDPEVLELNIIKSRSRADALTWLESQIQTELGLSPELVQVSMTYDRNSQEMATLLDKVIDIFIKEMRSEDKLIRERQQERMKSLLVNYTNDLSVLKGKYQGLLKALYSNNPYLIALGEYVTTDRVVARQKDRLELEGKKKKLEKQLKELQQLIDDLGKPLNEEDEPKSAHHISELVMEDQVNDDPVLKSLRADLQRNKETLEHLEKYWDTKKPVPARAKLIEDKKQLEDALKQRTKVVTENTRTMVLKRRRLQALEDKRQVQRELEQTKQMEEALKQEIDLLTKQVEEQEKQGVDTLKKEVDSIGGFVGRIDDYLRSLKADEDTPPRIRVAQEARIRELSDNKKQLMAAGVAGTGLLGLVILIVAYLEFLTRRINTPDDVIQGLGWRVVGALPALPDRANGLLRRVDAKYWHSLLTESVDATRTMLLHAARNEGLRTVMVTSAVAGEGKTSLSCHLATSLARAGRKTLLIDADLRSPAAHRLFELPAEPGFSEVLRGEANLPDVIRATPAANLWMIAAGKYDSLTLQALAKDGLPPIIEQLKEQFDFIVVDSSPVLPVVDALVIGQHMDVVIFSLLRDVSRIPNVYAAYQRLATLGIRMLGAVINGVQKDAYGYSYQYYAKQAN